MTEILLDRKLFGIGECCTPAELKQKYRELLKQYHPDLHNGDPEYHNKIIRLNEAYRRLSRAIYPSSRPRVIKELFRIRQPTMKPEEEAELLERIFTEFSRAMYYFTLVTAEYEESIWNADAREKVHFLMRHVKRYQAWKKNLNTRRRVREHESG